MVLPVPFQAGSRLIDGSDLNEALGGVISSYATGITARAGGGKASATRLTETVSRVTVVATAADSVLLPQAKPGRVVYVVNSGANAMQVFGEGIDTINGVITATGVSQGAGLSAVYICANPNAWFRNLSA